MLFKDSITDPLDPARTRRRLLRNTIWVSVAATLLASAAAGPRFGLSIGLGGALGVFNVRWAASSLGAMLATASTEGHKPPFAAWKFILRYFVIGVCILAALRIGWFSLPGILLGLCSFAGAAFIEAVYSLVISYRHANV